MRAARQVPISDGRGKSGAGERHFQRPIELSDRSNYFLATAARAGVRSDSEFLAIIQLTGLQFLREPLNISEGNPV